jgi:DNA-binding protein HU-beta
MLKPELITAIAKKSGYTKGDSENFIDIFIEVLYETLAKGEEVKIVNLGEWVIIQRDAHVGVNPKTKEKVEVPGKQTVKFNISNNLKNLLN